jgi:hypothetical protein
MTQTKCWRNKEGRLHRLDGPAIEWDNGDKEWFIDGCYCRLDNGPTVEYHTGTREWWLGEKLHRLDGPAVVYSNNDEEWFVDDERLTQEQFNRHPLVIFRRLCKEAL